MNKMAELAKLLGVELDEEFIIQSMDGYKCKCKLTNEGLLVYVSDPSDPQVWVKRNSYLYDLIAGKYEIKNLPWEAKRNEIYFAPHLMSVETYDKFQATDSLDDMAYERGLMCETLEQAQELAQLLIKTARKFQGFDDEEAGWKE